MMQMIMEDYKMLTPEQYTVYANFSRIINRDFDLYHLEDIDDEDFKKSIVNYLCDEDRLTKSDMFKCAKYLNENNLLKVKEYLKDYLTDEELEAVIPYLDDDSLVQLGARYFKPEYTALILKHLKDKTRVKEFSKFFKDAEYKEVFQKFFLKYPNTFSSSFETCFSREIVEQILISKNIIDSIDYYFDLYLSENKIKTTVDNFPQIFEEFINNSHLNLFCRIVL